MISGAGAPRRTGSALEGMVLRRGSDRPSVEHAAWLLSLLGAQVVPDESVDGLQGDGLQKGHGVVLGGDAAIDPATDWAQSGAMWLTGTRDGPPLVAPGAPASAARGAALAIEALTATDPRLAVVEVDGARLLGERAAIAGLTRRGSVSPGGSCRLIPAADALLAVNLPRRSDVELVGPWLQVSVDEDPWASVTDACSDRPAADLVARAQLIGIPVALVAEPGAASGDEQGRARGQGSRIEPWRVSAEHSGVDRGSPGTVVDLSSMWAGPLCANLLGLAGFEVTKVESVTRPDGARFGPPEFYDLLHAGHRSVTLDFSDAVDLARLRELMAGADVVIESSRPRALDQLGVGPDVVLGDSPSTVWVSITGYGRSGPWRNRVAFGDDAAAGAGLVVRATGGQANFCGDALADPLTGLHAALAALALWRAGVGALLDVPLRDVAASVLRGTHPRSGLAEPSHGTVATAPAVPERGAGGGSRAIGSRVTGSLVTGSWVIDTADGPVPVAEPWSRPVTAPAAPMGADNDLLA